MCDSSQEDSVRLTGRKDVRTNHTSQSILSNKPYSTAEIMVCLGLGFWLLFYSPVPCNITTCLWSLPENREEIQKQVYSGK